MSAKPPFPDRRKVLATSAAVAASSLFPAQNRCVGTDADTLIGIAHRSQDEHEEEKADQNGKEAGRQRQVVHVAHLSVLPFNRTAHGWKLLFWPKTCFGHLLHGFK